MIRPKSFDWLVLAFLVITWGSAFAALKIAVAHIPPLWNSALRLWIAVAALAAVAVMRREALPPLSHPAWRSYAVSGLVGMAAPFTLFAFAAERLPSALNAICNGATPIFTALLAHFLVTGERLTLRRALGVGLGFCGLLVLVGPLLQGGISFEGLGLIAAVGAAGLYATANIITKQAPLVPSAVGALMMCLWGAVFASVAALALGGPPPSPPLSSGLAVLALGLLPTALASIGYVFLIQRRGPMFVTMAIYLAPIWATLVGLVALGERPSWSGYAALALILGGVAMATLELRSRPA